jgi:hypothetical protein
LVEHCATSGLELVETPQCKYSMNMFYGMVNFLENGSVISWKFCAWYHILEILCMVSYPFVHVVHVLHVKIDWTCNDIIHNLKHFLINLILLDE